MESYDVRKVDLGPGGIKWMIVVAMDGGPFLPHPTAPLHATRAEAESLAERLGAEAPITQAERLVERAETLVARQEETVRVLEQDNHPVAAQKGREILDTLRESLVVAKLHLERLRNSHGGDRVAEAEDEPAKKPKATKR